MATQPTNTSDIVFLQLKWDFKLIDVYTRLGKSKSSSIIIRKDKKRKTVLKSTRNSHISRSIQKIPS